MSKNLSQEQANMAVAVALQREVADLQRQLAEAKALLAEQESIVLSVGPITCRNGYKHNRVDGCIYCQLAEAKAEIERLKERLEIGFGFDMDGNRISISENLPDGIECRDETIKLLQKSVDAMRPMVEACKESFDRHSTDRERILPCQCLICQWYRDYLGRKHL